MRPLSPTGLYWSFRGEVACVDHAPSVHDPRWNLEGWAPVTARSGTEQGTRFEYQCQHCAPDGRAIVRVKKGAGDDRFDATRKATG